MVSSAAASASSSSATAVVRGGYAITTEGGPFTMGFVFFEILMLVVFLFAHLSIRARRRGAKGRYERLESMMVLAGGRAEIGLEALGGLALGLGNNPNNTSMNGLGGIGGSTNSMMMGGGIGNHRDGGGSIVSSPTAVSGGGGLVSNGSFGGAGGASMNNILLSTNNSTVGGTAGGGRGGVGMRRTSSTGAGDRSALGGSNMNLASSGVSFNSMHGGNANTNASSVAPPGGMGGNTHSRSPSVANSPTPQPLMSGGGGPSTIINM